MPWGMSHARCVVVQFVIVAGCAQAFVPAPCPSLSRPSTPLHAHPRTRLPVGHPVGQPRVLSAERGAVSLRASISAGRPLGSQLQRGQSKPSPLKRLVVFALAVCTALALSFIAHVPAALAVSGTAFAASGAASAATVASENPTL